MNSNTKLTIEIKNKNPIELLDLTNSFMGFADEYRRFVCNKEVLTCADDVRLYIKEIRSGSVITDLIALSAAGLPFAENAVTILDFTKYLKTTFDYFVGKSDSRPDLEKQNLENLSQFIEPIAKDNASQVNCSTIINGNVTLNLNLNSMEAKAAQHTISREIKLLKEPVGGFHDKVVLYWYQARNDLKKPTGDRAIIESIHPAAIKTIFGLPELKSKILRDPFSSGYIVDVYVETIGGKPVLYKITDIHDKVDMPTQDDLPE